MILDEIKSKLLEIDNEVLYGSYAKLDRTEPWDYIVFMRGKMRRNKSDTCYVDTYKVVIVREEYVPDGLAEQVIEALKSIPGVRASDSDFWYDYVIKPNTSDTVEMLVLEFTKTRKIDV